jgi:hypothetical protein
LSGELNTVLKDGRTFSLSAGMSYQLVDDAESHGSSSSEGATLLIVD